MKNFILSLVLALSFSSYANCVPKRDASGNIARSSAQVTKFKKLHPCPNGTVGTKCGGYVVDHIVPLCACGADTPANMQWQTLADSKRKDRQELLLCKGINKK